MKNREADGSASGSECTCLSCRLQTAFMNEVSSASVETGVAIDAGLALAALIPMVSMLMAAIPYRSAEEWWLEVLSERSAHMMPDGTDETFDYKGRA